MPLDLRPLTLAELLDRSFSTYKRHVWLFAGIMAVPAGLGLAMAITIRFFNEPPPPGTPPAMVFRYVAPLLTAAFALGMVYMVIYLFAIGATTIAVSELYLGRAITIKHAYERVRPNVGRLILLAIWGGLRIAGAWLVLTVVSVALGLVLGFISSILAVLAFPIAILLSFALTTFMAVRYGVAVPALVLEGITAGQALARSVELTKGNLGRVFLIILCAIIIAYATAAIFQGPFALAALVAGPGTPSALVLGILGATVGSIGHMFSGPIMIIGLAMIYYDLRIRKEALDLQLLLENLDAPRPA